MVFESLWRFAFTLVPRLALPFPSHPTMVNVMNMIGIKSGPLATTNSINKGTVPPSFWLKRRQSSQVVSWFFGQKIQVDVSVSEIKKYGLGALLQSNVPLCYFLYYLLDNYCSENLVANSQIYSHANIFYYSSSISRSRVSRRITSRVPMNSAERPGSCITASSGKSRTLR